MRAHALPVRVKVRLHDLMEGLAGRLEVLGVAAAQRDHEPRAALLGELVHELVAPLEAARRELEPSDTIGGVRINARLVRGSKGARRQEAEEEDADRIRTRVQMGFK